MKVIALRPHPGVYTGRSYLVLGDWNALSDVNTLIDPGSDAYVSTEIKAINTGVGKKQIDQIILTHNHFDHGGGALEMASAFAADIWQAHPEQGKKLLHDGQELQLGDGYFTVHVLPIHSADSVCLYCKQAGVLFSGDTPLRVQTQDSEYPAVFVDFLDYLLTKPPSIIYPGHAAPMHEGISTMLRHTLQNIKNSSKQ